MTTLQPQSQNENQHPNPSLEQVFSVSLTKSVTDPSPTNANVTWQQIINYFTLFTIALIKDGPMIAFCHMVGGTKLGNINGLIHAIALDFDKLSTIQMWDALALAKRLSTHGIVHTTYSDRESSLTDQEESRKELCRCFRVILPFDTPVAVEQWSDVWHQFAVAFHQFAGATCDAQCKNPNRRYYLPGNPQGQVFLEAW